MSDLDPVAATPGDGKAATPSPALAETPASVGNLAEDEGEAAGEDKPKEGGGDGEVTSAGSGDGDDDGDGDGESGAVGEEGSGEVEPEVDEGPIPEALVEVPEFDLAAAATPIFLSGPTCEIIKSREEDGVTEESPQKLVPIKEILDDMQQRAAVSDFSVVKGQMKVRKVCPAIAWLVAEPYSFPG
jgi:hypothetical protein